MTSNHALLDYRAESAKALARRDAAIPDAYLLPPELLASLPQNRLVTPRACGSHFAQSELEIVESDADTLLQKIGERTWSSVDVTEAFCKSAAVANQIVRRPAALLHIPNDGVLNARERHARPHGAAERPDFTVPQQLTRSPRQTA